MMEAGRELDWLIMEKVMGRKSCELTESATLENALDHVPFYSTEIEDAWLVVEHFREKGTNVQVTTKKDGTFAVCEIQDVNDFEKWHSSEPYNVWDVPHAICLAAISACCDPKQK